MTADEFDDVLEAMLDDYSINVEKACDTAAERCAKGVSDEIKKHCSFGGSGKYIKAFKIERVKTSIMSVGRRWYVQAPYYRLTHLLENGHATRNGGRTRAFPHIQYGEEFAQKNYEEFIQEEVKKLAD